MKPGRLAMLAGLLGFSGGDDVPGTSVPRPTKKLRPKRPPSRRHSGPPYNRAQEEARRRGQIERWVLRAENGVRR